MIVNGESITIYYQVLFDQGFTLCLIVYQKMIVNPWKEQGQVFDMQLQGGGGGDSHTKRTGVFIIPFRS